MDAELLRKLAAEVRQVAERRNNETTVKAAQVLSAACALELLRQKVVPHA